MEKLVVPSGGAGEKWFAPARRGSAAVAPAANLVVGKRHQVREEVAVLQLRGVVLLVEAAHDALGVVPTFFWNGAVTFATETGF